MSSIPPIQEVRKNRKLAGLSQSELAGMVGISQSHLAKIEKGKVDPSYGLVTRLFDALEKAGKDECWRYMSKDVLTVSKGTEVKEIAQIMKEKGYSQVPVMDGGRSVGLVTETAILATRKPYDRLLVEDVMLEPVLVPKETSYSSIVPLLAQFQAVLVTNKGKMVGIITNTDMIGHTKKTNLLLTSSSSLRR